MAKVNTKPNKRSRRDQREVKELNKKQFNKDNSSRNERRGKEIVDSELRSLKSESNPFGWYNTYPEFIKYAGTLPYGIPLGETLVLETPFTPANVRGETFSIPGLLSMEFVPTIGYSPDKRSPINRAAIAWYTKLRQQQKASGDYDSQDLMISMLAIDSLFMYHEWMTRLLGISNVPSVTNKYVPEVFLLANHVDPDDIRAHSNDLWGYINQFAIGMQRYVIPKNFKLRERHSWLCSGLYLDAPNRKAQTYMFVPAGFYIYDNTVTTGSQLTYTKLPAGPMKVADIITFGENMLKAIAGDEDIGQICGDVMNAYGTNGVVTVPMVDAGYQVIASYDKIVLSQIENATKVGDFVAGTQNITQDPSVNSGAIIYTPAFEQGETTALNTHLHMLNLHTDTPTFEDNIEATRFTYLTTLATSSGNQYTPTAYGTELMNAWKFWTYPLKGTTAIPTPIESTVNIKIDPREFDKYSGNWVEQMKCISYSAAFDWAPGIYIYLVGGSAESPVYTFIGTTIDYDNVTLLDEQRLAVMHEAAIISLVDVQI